MLRTLMTLLIFVVGGTASSQERLITPADMRALADDGNIEGLESAFETVHKLNVAGEISADSLRDLVSALIVTDPVVLKTGQDWITAHPD